MNNDVLNVRQLKRLQAIAEANNWSVIEEVGVLFDKPVFRLRHADTYGKIGYPALYYFVDDKAVEITEHKDIVSVIKQDLFQSGGKRIQ